MARAAEPGNEKSTNIADVEKNAVYIETQLKARGFETRLLSAEPQCVLEIILNGRHGLERRLGRRGNWGDAVVEVRNEDMAFVVSKARDEASDHHSGTRCPAAVMAVVQRFGRPVYAFEKFEAGVELARGADRRLKMAVVAQVETIDYIFGNVRNRGLAVTVFRNEGIPLQWLLSDKMG